jgi:hypothetical protein
MAVTDISPNTVEQLSRKRLSFEGYVLIIGVIVVAALGIARWVWEPSFAQKQQAMQTALVSEHANVCDQLGKSNGSDRENCLTLPDGLYTAHQRAILADSGEI